MPDTLPTRSKSPSRLVRDKVLARWDDTGLDLPSPVERKYPPSMVALLVERSGATRNRVYRWLRDPDGHPLDWPELCDIAKEVGGNLRVMFSELQ